MKKIIFIVMTSCCGNTNMKCGNTTKAIWLEPTAVFADLRLISTPENYPWIIVKVISFNPELTRQRKTFLSVPIHG
jgi:hypothetical protein